MELSQEAKKVLLIIATGYLLWHFLQPLLEEEEEEEDAIW